MGASTVIEFTPPPCVVLVDIDKEVAAVLRSRVEQSALDHGDDDQYVQYMRASLPTATLLQFPGMER